MRRWVALACFFFSGFAGLVYEICWIREASLIFGSTTYALSTVVAVFFLGLAVGAELAGRWAPRGGAAAAGVRAARGRAGGLRGGESVAF